MKFQKKNIGAGGNFPQFIKKYETLKPNERVQIIDAGRKEPNRFQPGKFQDVFTIRTGAGEFSANFNGSTINSLIDEFGDDSELWKGRTVTAHFVKQNVSGKFVDVVYFAPDGYVLGANGFVKDGATPAPISNVGVYTTTNTVPSKVQPLAERVTPSGHSIDDVPTINIEEDNEEVLIEDVPF